MDVRAWITPTGVRQERAECECGWSGPVRTEYERGIADGDEHLLPLIPDSAS
jgi:hypothetical protein